MIRITARIKYLRLCQIQLPNFLPDQLRGAARLQLLLLLGVSVRCDLVVPGPAVLLLCWSWPPVACSQQLLHDTSMPPSLSLRRLTFLGTWRSRSPAPQVQDGQKVWCCWHAAAGESS